jgi:hypothetical protein
MVVDVLLGSTINTIQITFHAAHSRYMPCYTSHQPSGLWAQSGHIGRSRWNTIVVMSFATSGVDGSPMQASTNMLHRVRS